MFRASSTSRRPKRFRPWLMIRPSRLLAPGIPELCAVDRPGRHLRLRPGPHQRRPVDPQAGAAQPLRFGAVPDQCRLEGVPDRNVFALGQQVHDPAGAVFGVRPCPVAAERQCRNHHSAHEPVLPTPVRGGQRRRRAAAWRAVPLRALRQPRQPGHERCVADRRRDQGHCVELGLGRVVQLQREHVQGAAQKRLLPVHADRSPAEYARHTSFNPFGPSRILRSRRSTRCSSPA